MKMMDVSATTCWRKTQGVWLIVISVLFLGMLLPKFALAGNAAQCTAKGLTNTIDAGVINIPANVAVNTIVATQQVSFPASCYWRSGDQEDLTVQERFQVSGTAESGYTDIYPTGIAGLGVRYTMSSPECSLPDTVMSTAGFTLFICPYPGLTVSPPIDRTIYVRADFIITKNTVASGPLTTVPAIKYWVYPSDSYQWWPESPDPVLGTATGSLSGTSCTMAQSNLTVPLADVTVLDMKTVGATAAPAAFQLSLICPTGNLKVAITLTDNSNLANRTDILTLTNDSTARGVGIQIMNNSGVPVLMGPDSAVAGNTNQWVAGTTTGGSFSIPLTAQYIRTGSISGGSVKAIATYTMSYQ